MCIWGRASKRSCGSITNQRISSWWYQRLHTWCWRRSWCSGSWKYTYSSLRRDRDDEARPLQAARGSTWRPSYPYPRVRGHSSLFNQLLWFHRTKTIETISVLLLLWHLELHRHVILGPQLFLHVHVLPLRGAQRRVLPERSHFDNWLMGNVPDVDQSVLLV